MYLHILLKSYPQFFSIKEKVNLTTLEKIYKFSLTPSVRSHFINDAVGFSLSRTGKGPESFLKKREIEINSVIKK